MRLTLRTLLAFMDDILEPQDQEDLARQIEESEKGTELIHRTRDAMRRLRLGAPPVLGQGMELDPNFTSEYLDSTLSSEQMTDYQQVCLDSDIHLAEVASCHHILTMVLGEPAEIDPEMRRHMYGIPQRLEERATRRLDGAHTTVAATPAAAAPAAAPAATVTSTPAIALDEPTTEVPEYLRAASRSRTNRLLVAGLAVLVLGAGTWFLFGPQGLFTREGDVARNEPSSAPPAANQSAADQPQSDSPVVAPPADLGAGVATDDTATAPLTSDDDLLPPVPPADSPEVDEVPAAVDPDVTSSPDDAQSEFPPLGPIPPLPATPPQAPADTPDTGTDSGETLLPPATSEDETMQPLPPATPEVTPPAGDPPAVTPDPTGTPIEEAPAAAPTPSGTAVPPLDTIPPADGSPLPGPIPPTPSATDTAPAPAATTPPAAAGPLGTLTSPKDILLRYDPVAEQWQRVKVNTSIPEGARLMSLPTYRPSIALTTGLRLELSDGTMVELLRGSEPNSVVLNLTYGRVLMVNVGAATVRLDLAVGDTISAIEIEPARLLAIEISRSFTPGQPVEGAPDLVSGMVYVPQGGVVWTAGGVPTVIEGPSQWAWGQGPGQRQAFDERVNWLSGQQLDLLDHKASWNIEQTFDTQRGAGEQLLEFYLNSKRREEKVLAAKCATHVGMFVPFVEALADTNQRSNWDSHIEDLRAAMARSPELAQRVHRTLHEQRGSVPGMADDLFEMLQGYTREQLGSTPEELKAGILRKLIDWLGHDRLEYRVLAFHNLRQLTGGKTFMYNPAETDAERRNRNIRRWGQMLDNNELVPVAPAAAAPAGP